MGEFKLNYNALSELKEYEDDLVSWIASVREESQTVQGDSCSPLFFHSYKERGKSNEILALVDEASTPHSDWETIAEIARNYFCNLLTKEQIPNEEIYQKIFESITRTISESKRLLTEQLVTLDELHKVALALAKGRVLALMAFQ